MHTYIHIYNNNNLSNHEKQVQSCSSGPAFALRHASPARSTGLKDGPDDLVTWYVDYGGNLSLADNSVWAIRGTCKRRRRKVRNSSLHRVAIPCVGVKASVMILYGAWRASQGPIWVYLSRTSQPTSKNKYLGGARARLSYIAESNTDTVVLFYPQAGDTRRRGLAVRRTWVHGLAVACKTGPPNFIFFSFFFSFLFILPPLVFI